MATSTKIVLLALFGALMGIVILFFIGWLYSKGNLMSPVMTWLYWNDLITPAAILGALTGPFFFTIKEDRLVIQTSSRKNFLIGLLLLVGVGGFFSWQRNRNLQEVDNRYLEFCALLEKKDYTTLTHICRQPISKPSLWANFRSEWKKKEIGDPISFSQMCSFSFSYDWDKRFVTIMGNRSMISTNIDFSDFLASGTSISLEKIDNQWYFINGPRSYGMD